MRTVRLTFRLSAVIVMVVDETGYMQYLAINGVDKTNDGNAEMAVITAISSAGIDLQDAISKAFDKLYEREAQQGQDWVLNQINKKLGVG